MSNKENDSLLNDGQVDEDVKSGFVPLIVTTFGTVFIAELGDKTQLATLLLSAHSGKPLLVFLGAALALILTSLIGVLVGSWLSKVISPERFEQIAGSVMIGLGLWLGIESFISIEPF